MYQLLKRRAAMGAVALAATMLTTTVSGAAPAAGTAARAEPGPVTDLAVSGPDDAHKRIVTWSAPSSSLPIVSYRVTVKQHHQIVAAFSVTDEMATLRRHDLPAGRQKVMVAGISKDGAGPIVQKHFRVVKGARAAPGRPEHGRQ